MNQFNDVIKTLQEIAIAPVEIDTHPSSNKITISRVKLVTLLNVHEALSVLVNKC